MNKKIKFIAFYSNKALENENRQTALSASNKIDYICSVLVKQGYEVEIVSPSWTNNYKGFYKSNYVNIANNINLKTFASFGANNKLKRILKYIFALIQLLHYLLMETNRNETIIVYHSIMLTIPIKIARFVKNLKVVLEVEEIYQDVQRITKFMKLSEWDAFKNADSYIFSTELLNNKININNKPFVTINGTYKVEEDRKLRFNDDKIHIVYAGTFDPRKGGALAAAAAAEFLPENYHLHIIGFGSPEQIKNIQRIVININKKLKATIGYDGLLKGEEYISFLQKCHIGLSTQVPEAKYNESSFPSKILSYMANGLRVVSVRIKAIEKSAIGNYVFYYDGQKPEAIAEAIIKIDFTKFYDSRKKIIELDKEFSVRIIELLKK